MRRMLFWVCMEMRWNGVTEVLKEVIQSQVGNFHWPLVVALENICVNLTNENIPDTVSKSPVARCVAGVSH